MFSTKKAQVSLEYLIIFGFVIAAVLGVVAYLSTTGMFNPQQMAGDTQSGFSEVLVDDWAVNGNQLQLVLTNAAGESVTITNVYVSTDTWSNVTSIGQDISTGETLDNAITANLGQSYQTGDSYQMDVSVEYDTGALLQNSTGTLTGTA
ncbi:MAG: class III signal peptide-containing protein [Candidatus Aenigmatarchaeota archaeon]